MAIISESNLKIYNDYLIAVSDSLKTCPPTVKFYFYLENKYDERPRIRGSFSEKDNVIGFALNYYFKNEEDVLKTGKHEIAEWLQYVITEAVSDRRNVIHSSDPIFKKLMSAVAKYYPQYPQKLANYVKKQQVIYKTVITMDDINLYKKPKDAPENCVTWIEQVKIYDNEGKVLLDYHFFRVSPFCEDGYKHEMDEYLNKQGWGTGMMSITYKEAINPEEIIYCLAYKKAYEKIYYSVVKGHPLRDVQIKIREFLDLVDAEALKVKESYGAVSVKDTYDVVRLLKADGFEEV